MGITVWRLREQPLLKNFSSVYGVKNSEGKIIGILIANIHPDHTIEEKLLKKIAEAISPNISADVDMFQNDLEFMIVFGDVIVPLIDCHMIQTFSLSELIANPDHKKQLWKEIKALRLC